MSQPELKVEHGELLEDTALPDAPGLIERMAERFASFQRFLQVAGMPGVKRRRGESAMTASRRRKRSQVGRVRLGRPTGPTSLDELTKQKFAAYLERQAAQFALVNGGPVFFEPTPADISDDHKTEMREAV